MEVVLENEFLNKNQTSFIRKLVCKFNILDNDITNYN